MKTNLLTTVFLVGMLSSCSSSFFLTTKVGGRASNNKDLVATCKSEIKPLNATEIRIGELMERMNDSKPSPFTYRLIVNGSYLSVDSVSNGNVYTRSTLINNYNSGEAIGYRSYGSSFFYSYPTNYDNTYGYSRYFNIVRLVNDANHIAMLEYNNVTNGNSNTSSKLNTINPTNLE